MSEENKDKITQQQPELIINDLSQSQDEPSKVIVLPGEEAKAEKKERKNDDDNDDNNDNKNKNENGKDNEKEEEKKPTLSEVLDESVSEDESLPAAALTLRKVIGGDILTSKFMREQIWLILLIMFFLIIYIANRYSYQKKVIEISNLNTELKDAQYRSLAIKSRLTEKTRQSIVEEQLRQTGDTTLTKPDRPPFIIYVPEK